MFRPFESDNYYLHELEQHFSEFDDSSREKLQKIIGASSNTSFDLCTQLVANPKPYLDAVIHAFDAQSWDLCIALAIHYGRPIDITWASRETQYTLRKMGCLTPLSQAGEGMLPAVLSAILSTYKEIPSGSLLTLIDYNDVDRLRTLSELYDIPFHNPLEALLQLSVYFSGGAVWDIAEQLPTSDYLSAAFMIIELGGLCYWDEVFTLESEALKDDKKVLAFMPIEDRSFENRMIETLFEYGILFKIDTQTQPLAIIPEELWSGIWALGMLWLSEWARDLFQHISPLSTQIIPRKENANLHVISKWLTLEHIIAEQQNKPIPTPEFFHNKAKNISKNTINLTLVLLSSISAVTTSADSTRPNIYQAFLPFIDSPQFFAHHFIEKWIWGRIPLPVYEHHAIFGLNTIIGLDEEWRMLALKWAEDNEDSPSVFLQDKGVPSIQTGHGYLKDSGSTPETIGLELQHVEKIFTFSKVLFLDLLSMLSPKTWYAISDAAQLFQTSFAFHIFDVLSSLLQANKELYLPLYRSSYVGSDSKITEDFQQFTHKLFEKFFEPLGLVQMSTNTKVDAFQIRPSFARLSHNTKILDASFHSERLMSLEKIFEEELEFSTDLNIKIERNLFKIEEGESIQFPFDELLKIATQKDILSFDGKRLYF